MVRKVSCIWDSKEEKGKTLDRRTLKRESKERGESGESGVLEDVKVVVVVGVGVGVRGSK
jgi:hypothetical protein